MKSYLTPVEFDTDLINRYNSPTPRYTSYPPATELHSQFTSGDCMQAIARSNQRSSPISLYFHIPFCQTACYFCGCNVIVTQQQEKVVNPYLQHLSQDIDHLTRYLDTNRPVEQLHWGGGTPNYLNIGHVEQLWSKINQHFHFDPKAEISLEVNPRYIDRNYILFLRDLGFNRISFGIQDFNPQVQAAINRIQPEEMLFNVMGWIREAGFESVNVDLIYGLPYQTEQSFEQTIAKTIELDPDRIAVFNFAYVPWLKPVQKKIPQEALPSTAQKLRIFQSAIAQLTHNGYTFIGMDHFAKPNDELTIAQKEGHLHRNFQGYTTKPDMDLFGFGLTSISMLEDAYIQNHKTLKSYYQAVEASQFPIEKGVVLNHNDKIRRAIIMELMCHFGVDKQEFSQAYHVDFDHYFAQELVNLKPLEKDGLIRLYKDHLEVTSVGRLLIRNIAVIFDSYFPQQQQRFSKSI
ncbi:oxygen-independent coproporphyrinogen III oxidase [Spirulina subsalsa FACHB-351]|uniref:Coproporphyrinogen-III oxidase n=1 Tax=Spirulina subsalsa FACHB-351 TaxID=234711 RepID=A0ABT3LBU7_9CYAN|nr:oxygen-independent coproporphyrinogen III oxidase [Spirulina subsalsa]MCW6038942.1 oxygen-independent coproporphyrinogen III oxidase [Spirulina subsalsa FACHB-351]